MSDNLVLEQATATPVQPQERLDPYPYGWREVQVTLPNGEQKWQRIPLTLADVLHPQEEDVLESTAEHGRLRNYLYNALTTLLAADPTAHVLSNINVAWDIDGILPHRPDIAVILNVRRVKNWNTFDVREEGTSPVLIIEITSPKTRTVDLDDKYAEYEQVGVRFYIIVDIQQCKHGATHKLKGYRLTLDGYTALLPNEQGWLWLEPVKAWLGIMNDVVVCYDQDGNWLENYATLAKKKK